MKTLDKVNFDKIWSEVQVEANIAAKLLDVREMTVCGSKMDGACGFAWVTIGGRGNFAKYAKEFLGASKNYGGKGFQIWYSTVYDNYSQSVERHEAACTAAIRVLARHGINATVGSRMD